MSIPEPSAEQAAILDAVTTNNVLVEAVAGAGKTTTVLQIAARYHDLRILQQPQLLP
jgi:MoxR-like ATPase